MTSPSSHVFYTAGNSKTTRREGVSLSRVFITENKITLYSKEIVRTSKSGVLFEKIRHQTTYSLHENSRGVKYLKRYSKSAGGSFTDSSLEAVMSGGIYNNVLVRDTANYECRVLIEKTILNWFDIKFKERAIESHKAKLLFPAMRDEGFPRDETLGKTLGTMQKATSTVTKALRENESWVDFILDVGHRTVHTMEDVSIVKDHPNELLPISDIELPPLSALYAENSLALLNVVSTFTPHDRSLIRFMFKNLPVESRLDALVTLLALSKVHLECFTKNKNFRYASRYHSLESSLKRVPSNRRGELAEKLLHSFTGNYIQGQRGPVAFQDDFIVTQLSHTFRYWFAQEILEPKLMAKTTIEDIDARFVELFGVPLSENDSPVKFHKKEELTFCSLHAFFASGKVRSYDGNDLFVSLCALVNKNRPQDKGTRADLYPLNGYVGEDRVFVPVSGGLYSLDDLMQIIELGVANLDEILRKLGRELTPANRASFLNFRDKERKFKNTWKYYDLGVTDVTKILALKKAKVTKKDDIQTYNELPDEMFNELIALACGTEYNEVGKWKL